LKKNAETFFFMVDTPEEIMKDLLKWFAWSVINWYCANNNKKKF